MRSSTNGMALVVGFGASGAAAARRLLEEGYEVTAVDDEPRKWATRLATEMDVVLVERPSPERLAELARRAEEVVVSPGVPPCHAIFSIAGGPRPVGEVELAWRRARVPIVAITGTNGKTTVATLVTRMLTSSGVEVVLGGNIGTPLTDVVVGASSGVIVAEVSSFQLALTSSFTPQVGVWLNLAEDHLDWHPSLEHYVGSKARIWRNQGPSQVAIANQEDPMVIGRAQDAHGRLVTFGLHSGDYHLSPDGLMSPDGTLIAERTCIRRRMGFELSNALAACAASLEAGASFDGCREVLESFDGLEHRVEQVREIDGVRFVDDSKATTPSAVLAALDGFDSVVLIAGGRNKGLSMAELQRGSEHLRGVVAIGEAAVEVEVALGRLVPVTIAKSMATAVADAFAMARPGDTVLLSPGCASFDWYRSYAERGDDFKGLVNALVSRDASRRARTSDDTARGSLRAP